MVVGVNEPAEVLSSSAKGAQSKVQLVVQEEIDHTPNTDVLYVIGTQKWKIKQNYCERICPRC